MDGSALGRGSTFDSMGRRRWRTRGDTSTLMVGRRERRRDGGRKGGSRSDREEGEVRGGRNEESSEKNICGNVTVPS